jgi:O-methyltransferase
MIPLVLRIPGLRRYGAQITHLQGRLNARTEQLARAKEEAKRQEAAHRHEAVELVRSLTKHRQQLESMRAGFVDVPEAGSETRERFQKALQYDYYWYNAEKKLDLREIETFGAIAWRIREDDRTFLHFDRLYTLWQAVTALPEAATAVAEIGAYRGGSARFVAEAMRAVGRELPFYVCDTFRGHVDVDPSVDGLHEAAKQFAATDVDRVRRYLHLCPSVRILEGDIRETVGRMNPDERFGVVHIDVDVYPITRFCLEHFGPRVVRGGTIVVDDYGFTTCRGAKKAVDEFVAASVDYRMLHLTTGQAVLVRLAG